MLQCYKYCDNYFFIFSLIDIYTVLVVDRKHLLSDHGNNASVCIMELKIQSQNISGKLPSESLDICDILDQMP